MKLLYAAVAVAVLLVLTALVFQPRLHVNLRPVTPIAQDKNLPLPSSFLLLHNIPDSNTLRSLYINGFLDRCLPRELSSLEVNLVYGPSRLCLLEMNCRPVAFSSVEKKLRELSPVVHANLLELYEKNTPFVFCVNGDRAQVAFIKDGRLIGRGTEGSTGVRIA